MSKVTDYFLMKASPQEVRRSEDAVKDRSADSSGKLSPTRIILSLIGLIAGIILSFYITGINISSEEQASEQIRLESTVDEGNQVTDEKEVITEPAEPRIKKFNWKDFRKYLLITLVICLVSYQGLYLRLKLYLEEPVFLTLFVAFQYGFFWQSLIQGGVNVLS